MIEIEFEWELIYCDADPDSAEIIWADKKTGVHRNEVISMDGSNSNYIVRDKDGMIKVLKTLEEVVVFLGVSNEEWEQTLFDNRNGVLETIWLNKKYGIIKEEIVSKSGIDTSFTVVKTHQTYHTFEEAVLHS